MSPEELAEIRERVAQDRMVWGLSRHELGSVRFDRAALLDEVDRLCIVFEALAFELYWSDELDEGQHVAERIWTVLWGPGHYNAMQGWIRDQDATR